MVLTGGTIAAAVGVPIGALIAVHFGWRVTVAVTAVLGIVASGIIWVRLPRGIVGELRTLQERVAVLGNRGVPAALAMSVFYTIGAFAPGVYVAAIVTQTMHLGAVSIPFVLLANGLGAVAGGLMGGQLVDRLGSLRSFVLLVSVTIVMNGSISLLPVLPLPIGLPLLFCIYGLGGLTGWGIFACMLAILAGRAPQAVPLAISLNLTATNVGAALAALVGGFALDHFGASSIGLVGAIFPLMALGVAILNRKSLAKGR